MGLHPYKEAPQKPLPLCEDTERSQLSVKQDTLREPSHAAPDPDSSLQNSEECSVVSTPLPTDLWEPLEHPRHSMGKALTPGTRKDELTGRVGGASSSLGPFFYLSFHY